MINDGFDDWDTPDSIIALGREPGSGLVVMPDVFMIAHRAPIISAAARNKVPAVYNSSDFARDGGLLSYGYDFVDSRPCHTPIDHAARRRGHRLTRHPISICGPESRQRDS